MKKKNFDICLYGHLSFDNIFIKFKNITSIGCMGNVWKDIKSFNPNLKVSLIPTSIGESIVLINEEESKRTSKSILNIFSNKPKIESSKIYHLMYINELPDISFISELDGFVTADVCNGNLLDIDSDYLTYIDLLFISDEDCHFDVQKLLNKIPNILLHEKNGSTLYRKDSKVYFYAEIVDNVNVLGMGDKLASYIICNLISNNFNIEKSIQPAHDQITFELKKKISNNEKI